MDYFLAVVRRLTFVLCVVLIGALAVPRVAHADNGRMSRAEAFAACDAKLQSQTTIGDQYCYDAPSNPPPAGWYIYGSVRCVGHGGCAGYVWGYGETTAPVNPCRSDNVPSGAGLFAGRILASSSWCKSGVPDGGSGGTVSCSMTFAPSGPPTRNQWGNWNTPGTLSVTGDLCDGAAGGGSNNWKAPDGTPAGDPIPPSPDTAPPKTPAPQTCGGGSCYDPANDQFCAVAGGAQVCVPGGAARGDNGGASAGTPNGNAPGACSSSSTATVCAGAPSAPKPSPAVVPDPPTQVVSNDTYTQANPSTGSPIVVQTTTYNSGTSSSGDTPPTSGQQAGDSGPAPASSTGSTSGSYGGGGDCNTPPVCSGDAVMCGIARQQWTAMCSAKASADQIHKDLAGDGPPSDLDSLKNKYGQGDVWSAPGGDGSLDGTVGGQANNGVYDQSGFGFGTACPLHDISVSLGSRGSFVIPLEDKCVVGQWLRALVIGFALLSAAIITAGGRGI